MSVEHFGQMPFDQRPEKLPSITKLVDTSGNASVAELTLPLF
jgi:hypothetical protein